MRSENTVFVKRLCLFIVGMGLLLLAVSAAGLSGIPVFGVEGESRELLIRVIVLSSLGVVLSAFVFWMLTEERI